MSTFETFTAEEIISLLEEICSEVDRIIDDEDEDFDGGVRLLVDADGIRFVCFLMGEEPFFDGLSLLSARSAPPNPLHFCNHFNSGPGVARAFQLEPFDDDDIEGVDENGRMQLMARLFINFDGGVTKKHLELLLHMWIEDLYTFNEIGTEEDDEEVGADVEFEIPSSLSEVAIPLVERISVLLEVRKMLSARDIARVLGVNKQSVNRVLYRHLEIFRKSSNQPPLWSTGDD